MWFLADRFTILQSPAPLYTKRQKIAECVSGVKTEHILRIKRGNWNGLEPDIPPLCCMELLKTIKEPRLLLEPRFPTRTCTNQGCLHFGDVVGNGQLAR